MFPKFIRNTNTTLNLTSGESHSTPCQASGFPRPTVNWIKEERSSSSNRVRENFSNVEEYGRVSNLTLTNVISDYFDKLNCQLAFSSTTTERLLISNSEILRFLHT